MLIHKKEELMGAVRMRRNWDLIVEMAGREFGRGKVKISV